MGIDGVLWAAPIADGIAIIIAAVITVTYFKSIKADSSVDR